MSAAVGVPASDAASSVARFRFNGDIGLGHVLQAGMIGVGLIVWLVAGQTKTEGLAASVQSLQGQVAQQATSTREQVADGLRRVEGAVQQVQSQVAPLPDLAARLRQLEEELKRANERHMSLTRYLDERRTVSDQRFQALEQRAIEARAAIDGLHQRANQVNLPGSPGIRR